MSGKGPHDTVVEPAIEVELSYRTDPGRDPEKQVNEDSGFHKPTRFGTLCVVCDGMGGHANGQDASRAAVTAIEETFDRAPNGSVGRDLLRAGITLGHERIRGLPLAGGEARAGSTVVAVLITPHGAEIAHVGDSRVYFCARGRIEQVTRDHSMVQLMVEAGMIKPEEAATHPDANKIMRALGIATTVDVDLRPEPLAFGPGDIFVLASDGLTDLVSEAEILQMAGSLPGEQAVGQLVDLANARGGHDNITVLLARPRDGSHVSSSGPAKTVPVTAIDPFPGPQQRSSPATVLAAPLPMPVAHSPATAMAAPLPLPPQSVHAMSGNVRPAPTSSPQLPLAPPSRPRARQGPSTVLLALGAFLAIAVAIGAAVALYTMLDKPKHHAPQIVVPLSALPLMGDDAGAMLSPPQTGSPEPPTDTPPLAPVQAPHPRHPHAIRDGGAPLVPVPTAAPPIRAPK